MFLFRAIGRLFRSIGYLLTGNIDMATDSMRRDPNVVRAAYDNVVSEKIKRIKQYRDAVASMIAQEEQKKATVKTLTDEVNRLERLKAGAAARARQIVDKLKKENKNDEEIKANQEYKECLAAFNDFASTLKEKLDRIAELERDIGNYTKKIADHKVQLLALMREIEKIKEEKHDAVADFITAREEREIADMLSGLQEDGTAGELARMRELRNKVKAEARVASELAGTDSRGQEEKFLQYARESVATGEFEDLVGISTAKQTETTVPAVADSKLPE